MTLKDHPLLLLLKKASQSHLWAWAILTLSAVFVSCVRLRLLNFPLERDEGEYAYMGQLILQGIPPYTLAYNMKPPGTYTVYALIMQLFGETTQGIHLGFLAINLISIGLVFLISRRLINNFAAAISAATYAVLSLSPSVLGFAGHATHCVVLFMLIGFLLLLKSLENPKTHLYFFSGFSFGLSILMKQPAVFFLAFAFSAIIFNTSRRDTKAQKKLFWDLCVFSLGVAVPLLAAGVIIYISGAFDKFWFWTVTYLRQYGTQVPLSSAVMMFQSGISSAAKGFTLLWVMSFLGIIAVFFSPGFKDRRTIIALFIFFSFLSICPGFYFRAHYFITLLPAIAILTGAFFDLLSSRIIRSRFAIALLFLISVSVGTLNQKDYFFTEIPDKLCRKIYGSNPFPESIEISEFIRSRTAQEDTIAVLGSEPQIYFYSKRHSATGYIYTYNFMEKHKYSLNMQKEMAGEIESSKPKFIIFVSVPTSWLAWPDSEPFILNWANQYIPQNYYPVGVTDMFQDRTLYLWDKDASNYTPRSKYNIRIYQRIGSI